MRLLNVHSLEITNFRRSLTPKYAIASHRWYAEQETSYQDVKKGRNTDKYGYVKIQGFAEYIKRHLSYLDWIWIDTCCIAKASSQEVSESVNSMFRWYSQADICLAYLSDVPGSDVEDLIHSEWFTRGWTLQELLAPKTVIFLAKDWQVIGHKGPDAGSSAQTTPPIDLGRSLNRTISFVTKIPEAILMDFEESTSMTVDQKLAWITGRKTTIEEDMSYCLFGILDVAIGANYGEGGDKSRRRLLKEVAENEREKAATCHAKNSTSPEQAGFSESAGRRQLSTLRKMKESLHFPQMNDRKTHIHSAYRGTYQWALHYPTATDTRWHNLLTWLSDNSPSSHIYWINAKPGAGKSSLIRFIDDEVRIEQHLQPWVGRMPLYRGHYYFWNPGGMLQRTLLGLLRTIMHQLLEQVPELMLSCVSAHKQSEIKTASASGNVSWTVLELRECLRKFIHLASPTARILFCIDGLDEIEGNEDNRDELIEVLKDFVVTASVKICLSSRRWAVFEDAFARCPQLRLEDLNARDIEIYVHDHLMAQQRYTQMLVYDPSASRLIHDVTSKSHGVFLWTCLVVKELVRGIRDGDNYHTLTRKLQSIPPDLNDYFSRLMESIEPYHRREASILLQIALHQENQFVTLNPIRLIDLMFIQDAHYDFALSGAKDRYVETFQNAGPLLFALDSTVRRISSLCKGLLECLFDGGSTMSDFVIQEDLPGEEIAPQWENETWSCMENSPRTVTSLPYSLLPVLQHYKYAALDFRIVFMHRSLRDYLLEPIPFSFLVEQTRGVFDARNYLRNARLVEISMAVGAGLRPEVGLGLASYVLSTLSVPSFRHDPRCAQFVAGFLPLIPYVWMGASSETSFWYICRSIESWTQEQSNFYTLSIDFGLTAWLTQTLTADAVRGKAGRPMLDYALRTRFFGFDTNANFSIGLQYPDPELVRHLLALGADPNQTVGSVSIWPLFLSFIVEYNALHRTSKRETPDIQRARSGFFAALESMITAGASYTLKQSDLCAGLMYGMYATTSGPRTTSIWHRWPRLAHLAQLEDSGGLQSIMPGVTFDLPEVLECLRPVFGGSVDTLKTIASNQMRVG